MGVAEWVEPAPGASWVRGYDSTGRLIAHIWEGSSSVKIHDREYTFKTNQLARKFAETFNEKPKGKFMLKDIASDFKGFVHDNRNVLYWLAVAFLIDHFFLGGTFRARLHALVEKMIGKAEQHIAQ